MLQEAGATRFGESYSLIDRSAPGRLRMSLTRDGGGYELSPLWAEVG